MKRLLSIILSVALILCMVPATAMADSSIAGLTYSIFDAKIPFENIVDCQRTTYTDIDKLQQVNQFTYVKSSIHDRSTIDSLVEDVKDHPEEYYYKFIDETSTDTIGLNLYKNDDPGFEFKISTGGEIQSYGDHCFIYVADSLGSFVSFRYKDYHRCGSHLYSEHTSEFPWTGPELDSYRGKCILCGCGEAFIIEGTNPTNAELKALANDGDDLVEFEKTSAVLSTDIGEKTFVAGGDWVEFTFTTTANDDAGKIVYGGSDFGVAYEEKIAGLEYKEGDQWINMKGQNFGQDAGFPLIDGSSTFRVKFTEDAAGNYTFTAAMKLFEGGDVVCDLNVPFVVQAKASAVLSTDIGEKTFVAGGDWVEFTFTTTANDDAGKIVYGGSDFGAMYEDKIAGLEYKAGDQWIDMKGQNFGQAAGFPLTDATSTFRVKFAEGAAGNYTFTAAMKLLEDDSVVCDLNVPFTVAERQAPAPTPPFASYEKPEITVDDGGAYNLGLLGTSLKITVKEGYELVDVTVNGVSKGAVTELKALKTGDKVVIETKPIAEEPEEPAADVQLVARSKMSSAGGKKAVKVYWYAEDGSELSFDGYEIFRSVKRFEGYGNKPFFTTEREVYWNTDIEDGQQYYYKVRGYNLVDGEKVYTDWSLKAWRTVE